MPEESKEEDDSDETTIFGAFDPETKTITIADSQDNGEE